MTRLLTTLLALARALEPGRARRFACYCETCRMLRGADAPRGDGMNRHLAHALTVGPEAVLSQLTGHDEPSREGRLAVAREYACSAAVSTVAVMGSRLGSVSRSGSWSRSWSRSGSWSWSWSGSRSRSRSWSGSGSWSRSY